MSPSTYGMALRVHLFGERLDVMTEDPRQQCSTHSAVRGLLEHPAHNPRDTVHSACSGSRVNHTRRHIVQERAALETNDSAHYLSVSIDQE